MPILQYGKFNLHLTGVDFALAKSQGITLTYYPVFNGFCLFVLLGFLYLLWNPTVFDASYHRAKCWMFLPLSAGLFIHLSGNLNTIHLAFPLLALTLILGTWRLGKQKHWFIASLTVYILFFLIQIYALIYMNPFNPAIYGFIMISAIECLASALPVIAIRIAIHKKFTVTRLGLGLFIGLLLSLIGLWKYIISGVPLLRIMPIVGLAPILLSALIFLNPWVRDVATGKMFVKKDDGRVLIDDEIKGR